MPPQGAASLFHICLWVMQSNVAFCDNGDQSNA